jgi:hypothetical protein
MATVVKDFKIKSGLIVEGTTGRINNFDILTKKQADQDFIIDLIGGETLVKSVGTNLSVDGAGELSLDLVGIVEDIAGTRLTTDGSTINVDVDGIADDLTGSYDFATNSDVTSAVGQEATNRDSAIATAKQEAIDAAALDATSKADAAEEAANDYTDGRETAITTAYQSYADTAEADAISAAASDATTKANNAEQNAKDYADDVAADAEQNAKNYADGLAVNYDEAGSADQALVDAKAYTDQEVAALVDGAPALLDTLNELAAAIADNPNYATDVANLVAGKQDTLTAGSNISIVDETISVTGLYTDDVAEGSNLYFTNSRAVTANEGLWDTLGAADAAQTAAETFATNAINALDTGDIEEGSNLYFTNQRALDATSAAYDAAGSASTAEANANDYTDNAISALDSDDIEEGVTNLYYTESRAKTDAAELLTGATLTNITITGNGSGLTITAENGVADSTTDDLDEGEDNLYFTNERAVDALQGTDSMFATVSIDEVALQIAATLSAATAGVQSAYTWNSADYSSAEFLVKVAYGTHTEISKVLLTLDTSDNVAITEYGIVGTNGSASSISASVAAGVVSLDVTTANNNSTVTVVGTLLA